MPDVPSRDEFDALAQQSAAGLSVLDARLLRLSGAVDELTRQLATHAHDAPARLTWAPPVLENPATVEVHNDRHSLKLDPAKDYILKIRDGSVNVGAGRFTIQGGRNVVLIGGEIVSTSSDRPLALQQQTGTLHVEGVHLTGGIEGINIDQRQGATVQLQNILVDAVSGSYAGHHADVVQTWAGPRTLRVDRLEGTTNYQGFFLDPYKFLPGVELVDWDLRNVLIRGVAGAAYCFWLTGNTPVHHLENLAFASDHGHATWDRPANFAGVQRLAAGEGESVLLGKPGAAYVSPGYV